MTGRVLFVTPYAPPAAGSGVQRGAKFARYLKELGWEVRIVTIDASEYPEQDESMLADLDGVEVRRILPARLPVVRHRMLRAAAPLGRAVREEIREFRPSVVLATAPDYHWVPVVRAARRRRIPVVVDYPDPWTVLPDDFLAFRRPPRLRARLKWALAPFAERWCLARASAVVFATQPILHEYAKAFPRVGRIGHLVTNGADPSDFDGISSEPPGDLVRITHVGSFGGSRTPIPIARVAAAAAERLDRPVEVSLVGAGAQPFLPEVRSILGSVGLRATGWVSHRDAIEEMCGASVLWLDAMAHLRSASTGKVFEYLMSGRPMIALAHRDSPAAELVRHFDAGVVIDDPADTAAVAAAIEKLAARPTRALRGEMAAYDRRVLAGQLSEVLSEASAGHP